MTNKKRALLEQIMADIVSNNICPDLAREATNLVLGEGDLNADIVFIGEAPGKKEDESGRPFVGTSGKFLNEMLDAIGLSRDDIYITNIVKYRPPGNRDPSKSEKQAFLPYLVRQLAAIQPKIVVTLGRHSMNCFLPAGQISEIHGQATTIDFYDLKITVVPLYHPAAALYNGSLRTTLINDFKMLPKIIDSITE